MHPSVPVDRPQSILIVDDDATIVHSLRAALRGLGDLRFAMSGVDALRLMAEQPADLLLIDAEMPGMSGFQVLDTMHTHPQMLRTRSIVITRHSDIDFECQALNLGAVDFITKPLNPMVVTLRVKTQLRLLKATEQLQRMAMFDGLTMLNNRRSFDDAFSGEWKRSLRSQHPLSVLMIDIDHFKRYNDTLGHQAGDVCLQQVAQSLRSRMHRSSDMLARYGGEEFVALLPMTDSAGALQLARYLCGELATRAIPHPSSPTSQLVTISVGVSSLDDSSSSWSMCGQSSRFMSEGAATEADLLKAADTALYAAKSSGRARACYRSIDVATNLRLADTPLA